MEGIEERNGLLFCRNEERNEFIFEEFNIMKDGTDYFLKETLTTLNI